jgi:hypothetical protein
MALQDEQIGAATRELMKEGLRGEG